MFTKVGENGQCRAFDAEAEGYCRSDGIVSIFLQKSKDARRIYLHPIAARSNCDGYKSEGISYPSPMKQSELLTQLYSDSHIDPNDVEYVECHGTGTKAGDLSETTALTSFFFNKQRNRQKHMLIGSTKTNMGHPEPCSGLSSICKIISSVQLGIIPKNLHFNKANPELTGNFLASYIWKFKVNL